MTINYYLNYDNRCNSLEKAIFAYIRGISKGKTIVLHTGERIKPKYWDKDKQIAKKSYPGSPELNVYLQSFKEEIQKTIRLTLAEDPASSYDKVRAALIKRFEREDRPDNFFDMLMLFIEVRSVELSDNSIKKFLTLRKHLLEFQEKENYIITFNSINMLFFDRFTNYLMNEKGHISNTVHKLYGFLKIFLNWATERKLNTNLEYQNFKTKSYKTDIIYLTESELLSLLELDLTARPALEKVRDVFCFGCFTGQRFSDVSGISSDDIKGDFWHLRVAKTRDILEIPLNEYAKELLSKYFDQDKPLPVISNQKTNEYLKELCKIAGINEKIMITKYRGAEKLEETFEKYELVTTHTARRTFVTLSLEKGMRPEMIMEITGHKDYKTFKKYIKIVSNVKLFEMNNIWSKEPTLKLAK